MKQLLSIMLSLSLVSTVSFAAETNQPKKIDYNKLVEDGKNKAANLKQWYDNKINKISPKSRAIGGGIALAASLLIFGRASLASSMGTLILGTASLIYITPIAASGYLLYSGLNDMNNNEAPVSNEIPITEEEQVPEGNTDTDTKPDAPISDMDGIPYNPSDKPTGTETPLN